MIKFKAFIMYGVAAMGSLLLLAVLVLVDKAEGNLNVLLFAIILIVLYVLLKYPEMPFVLFLTAGHFKGAPALHLPEFLDLTILFAIITIIGIAIGIARKKIRLFIPPNRLMLPYIVIILLSIINLLYTPSPIYGTDKFLRFLTITSFAMFGPLLLGEFRLQLHHAMLGSRLHVVSGSRGTFLVYD